MADSSGLRLFTLEEARDMLPELRVKLELLQQGKQELKAINEKLRDISPSMRSNGSGQRAHELELRAATLVTEMGAALAEVEESGVLVKDLDQGLVDFPAWRDGRVVLLCWMASESEITHWHEIDEGFRGRQSL